MGLSGEKVQATIGKADQIDLFTNKGFNLKSSCRSIFTVLIADRDRLFRIYLRKFFLSEFIYFA